MCISPVVVKHTCLGVPTYEQVPCGKCIECTKSYQNSWAIRLFEQFKSSKSAYFFTLTYREDIVPYFVSKDGEVLDRTVNKRDVQKWLKRLRSRLDKVDRPKMKYFITSEYGPTTLRPHYHGVLFNVPFVPFFKSLCEWRDYFGFFSFRRLNYVMTKDNVKTFQYVGKYCCKGEFENPNIALGRCAPTFHLISKGIGLEFVHNSASTYLSYPLHIFDDASRLGTNVSAADLRKCIDSLINSRRYRFPDAPEFEYSLPRYYVDKIFNQNPRVKASLKIALRNQRDRLCKKKLEQIQMQHPDFSFYEAVSFLAEQDASEAVYRAEEQRKALARKYAKSKI